MSANVLKLRECCIPHLTAILYLNEKGNGTRHRESLSTLRSWFSSVPERREDRSLFKLAGLHTVSRKRYKPKSIFWGLASWEMFHQRRLGLRGDPLLREVVFSSFIGASWVQLPCSFAGLGWRWQMVLYHWYTCWYSSLLPKIEMSELQSK